MWVAGVDRAKPGYVVLVAAKDTDKAQEAIDKGAKSEKGVKERSYNDVDYQVDADGVAAGIVGDFVAIGTEPEFKRTVRAEDGDSLADEKRFKNAIDDLDDDRIGSFYVDLKPFIEQAVKSDPKAAGQLEQIRSIFPIDKLEPMSGALLADGDRIAFDTIMRGSGVKSLGAFGPFLGTGKTPLIAELPGDSWAAYGAPNVGPGLKSLFTRVAGAFGGAAATQQLQQQYGIDLERDVFGWIGDMGLFVRGSDKASLEGGLVIKATNAGNMRNAFGKIVGLIQSQGGKKASPVKVKGAAAAFSTRPDRRPRQARHPRPLRRPRGDRRRPGGDRRRAGAGLEARGLRALRAGEGPARRRRPHPAALDARPREGRGRLGRHRRRLAEGEALPRSLHRDRQRRRARRRRAPVARGRRPEVSARPSEVPPGGSVGILRALSAASDFMA